MKSVYIFVVFILCFVNLKAQTLRNKELNSYYSQNVFFNKKPSEIKDLELKQDFNDNKVYTLKSDNEYFGTLKLISKPEYFFFKGLLHKIVYYTTASDLNNNVDYITKLFHNPNGYTEVFPDLLKKETEKKYFWKGYFMAVEVNEAKIAFIDLKVDGNLQIANYDYWKALNK